MQQLGFESLLSTARSRIAPILLIITVMATVGRLAGLGDDSLWQNEILSYQRATAGGLSDAYRHVRDGNHPPLYSIGVLRPWFKLGRDEWFQRLPSAVFGVATILCIFAIGRTAFGNGVAVLAALLLSVSPLHLYYSREGRMYSLLALLVTLVILCQQRAVQSGAWRWWAGYTLIGAASLYTHYYAGFTLLAIALCAAVLCVRARKFDLLGRWLAANAGIALLFAPWLPTFWFQLHNDPVAHLKARPLSLNQVAEVPVRFYTGFETVPGPVSLLILVCIAVAVVSGFMKAKRASRNYPQRYADFLVLSSAFLGTIALAAAVSAFRPLIFIRYFLGIVPVVCLLVAFGAWSLRPRALGVTTFGVLLAYSLFSSYHVVTDSWRPDYRGLVSHLESNGKAGDVVLVLAPSEDTFHSTGFRHYYQGDLPVFYVDGGRVTPASVAAIVRHLTGMGENVWVVQVNRATKIQGPVGDLRVVSQRIYRSRLFARKHAMGLALLSKEPGRQLTE